MLSGLWSVLLLGVILSGCDVFALDTIMAKIMGLDPEDVPTIKQAGDLAGKDIEIKGEDISKINMKRFKLASPLISQKVPKRFIPIAQQFFYFHIRIRKEKCTFCGKCFKACPADAIELNNEQRNASIRQKKCIQCFCCREVCPVSAIYTKKSLGFRLLTGLVHLRRRYLGRNK